MHGLGFYSMLGHCRRNVDHSESFVDSNLGSRQTNSSKLEETSFHGVEQGRIFFREWQGDIF